MATPASAVGAVVDTIPEQPVKAVAAHNAAKESAEVAKRFVAGIVILQFKNHVKVSGTRSKPGLRPGEQVRVKFVATAF